jgi:hypothetical protein
MIRIPLEFVSVGDAFAWLINDEARENLKAAVASGAVSQEIVDRTLQNDEALRALDGAFVGDLVFRDDLDRDSETLLYTSALQEATAATAREVERAKAAGRQPRCGDLTTLASAFERDIRAEMLFERAEGKGADKYPGWDSLPRAIRESVPSVLHMKLFSQQAKIDDLLKKKPSGSQGRKVRSK